jgi:hypothetical protein
MDNNNDPLTPQEIHRALALHEEGIRPDGATIRCALLMALALHAAQAVTAQQAARIAELEAQVAQYRAMWEAQHAQA